MMAFVLVQTAVNAHPVAAYLRTIDGVQTADDVKGPYDAIALATPDEKSGPIERILAQIRQIPGVTRALPAPVGEDALVAIADGEAA